MASIRLNVFVDKKKSRVIFVESDKDFVDILLSFLTLPFGTILRLIRSQSPSALKCMRNLYNSVENLNEDYFSTKECKTMLLRPRNGSDHYCRNLKLKVEDLEPDLFFCGNHKSCKSSHNLTFYPYVKCSSNMLMNKKVIWNNFESDGNGVFVQGSVSIKYVITDDLQVFSGSINNSCMPLLHKLGISDFNQVEERTIDIGLHEVLRLLNRSLMSKTPLTDVLLNKGKSLKAVKVEPIQLVTRQSKKKIELITQYLNGSEIFVEGKKIIVKLIVKKSTKEIMYAETREDFIDLLVNFLPIPLGYMVKLSSCKSSMECIDNLYRSVEKLGDENFIKSEECKAILLRPKGMTCSELRGGRFVKGPATFMVGDELEVVPFSHMLKISFLSQWKVPVDDVVERYVNVGAREVLNLLKASLVSKKALSSVFKV